MPNSLGAAVEVLNNGGVIAYPTEAVWGLGCDPFNYEAVEKLKLLKTRSNYKGLILVASHIDQLGKLYLSLDQHLQNKLRSAQTKPTTWLIEDVNSLIPKNVKGDFSSVAIRISSHPIVVSLCESFDGMLVSTSANVSGESPALTLEQAKKYFGPKIDAYVDGLIGSQKQPSQIIDLVTGQTIRA